MNLKAISYFTVLVLGLGMFFSSCSKDESAEHLKQQELNTKQKTYHIYYAEWEDFGRGTGCDGWGLCNFQDCWFCCTENDVIVDCESSDPMVSAGTITVDDSTNAGNMTIALNSSYAGQGEAITYETALVIESNLTEEMEDGSEITLLSGTYPFNSSVGSEGGYIVNVTWVEEP